MAYTPYDSAIPGSDLYAQADVMATNAYNKALAQINEQRLGLLRGYGYLGDVDASTGVLSNVRVDPGNLYGKLQSLYHNQALEDRSAEFAAEDRGLHGGLANQAASELKYAHGAQRTQLGSDFTQGLSGFQQAQNEAAYTRDQTLYQAQLEQIRLALEAGLFNPPDDGGDGEGGTPPAGDDDGNASHSPFGPSPASIYTNAAAAAVARAKKSGTPIPYVHSPGANTSPVAETKKKKVVQQILGGGGGRSMMV